MIFNNLFAPIRIKTLNLKNRIVLPAMVAGYADENGYVTDRYVKYMERRARGGAGLLITEAAYIAPAGKILRGEIAIHNDSYIDGLTSVVEAVHKHDAKIAIQLNHGGRQTTPEITNCQIVAPSSIPCPRKRVVPKQLSLNEIEEIIQMFAKAALRAKKTGADAIEIHGAHGYLIGQFLSPYSNFRKDKYGLGSKGHITFTKEVIESIRKEVGKETILIFRLSADEFVKGGLTLRETLPIAKKLVDMGIDILNVTGAVYGSVEMMVQPMQIPQGCLVHLAESIKKSVSVPVIAVGRINDPDFAENIIADEKADLVAIGRGLIADPEFANKARQGNKNEIRKCVACTQGCVGVHAEPGIKCIQNPAVGKAEEHFGISSANIKKNVIVVGGGPAGMEAARVAAHRGHKVTLFEEKENLGGQLLLAAIPPGKKEIMDIISWRQKEIKRLGVNLQLGIEATPSMISQNNPDIIIMATGAEAFIPRRLIHIGSEAFTANDVLSGKRVKGNDIVILGGGLVGCEVALFLSHQGKSITLVEMEKEIATNACERVKIVLIKEIVQRGINVLTNTSVEEVIPGQIKIQQNNCIKTLEADFVVFALGSKPKRNLINDLRDSNLGTVMEIGDCVKPRTALEAIEEGFNVGLKI